MMNTYQFTKKEEILHAITHGFGIVLSLTGLIFLITFATMNGSAWEVVSVIIFGLTMVLMYTTSTLVHSLPKGKLKDLFQIFDHSSIYLFIAGTYTPFLLVNLRGPIGWTIFGIIWGIAIVGVVFKVFFAKKFLILSTLFYVLMGWLIVIVWNPLTNALHANGILLLAVGGVVYTVGAFFYVCRKIPYHHVIWHLFVLIGSVFHYFAVFYYVI